MKKTLDIKKLILLNMPYILLGLFATNFGEAWRMARYRLYGSVQQFSGSVFGIRRDTGQ